MLAITDVSNCQQKFCFLYYLFASSKVVKVFPILRYNNFEQKSTVLVLSIDSFVRAMALKIQLTNQRSW